MKRLATAVVGIPVAVLLSLYAPLWLFALVVGLIAALCLDELFGLAETRMGVRPGPMVLILAAVVTIAFAGGVAWGLAGVTFAMLAAGGILTFSVSLEDALPKAAVAALGILYCGVLLGFLVLIAPEKRIVLLGIVWVGDAAAYYGGRHLGRHPLAPGISPRKTVEGALAGLIGSVIAGVIIGIAVTEESPARLLGATLFAASAGQVGDLAESALKRSAGVKDSSSILPGHGGMLDRMDSLLFAAPVFYWFMGK